MSFCKVNSDELFIEWKCTKGFEPFPQKMPRPGLLVHYRVTSPDRMHQYSGLGMLCDLQVAYAANPTHCIEWKVRGYPNEKELKEANTLLNRIKRLFRRFFYE